MEGRRAFRRHVDYLRALVEGVDENEA